VLAEDGSPLADVLVRAIGRPKSPLRPREASASKVDERDLEEKVRDLVAEHLWMEATQRETRTDANGDYVLAGLADAIFSLAAHREGYEIQAVDRSGGILPDSEVDFRAAPVVAVPVALILPDGGEPPRARVSFEGSGHKTSETWTPARSTLRVRPGTYRVEANVEEPVPMMDSVDGVALEVGGVASTVTLFLRARTGIRGRVIFPRDEEPESVLVLLQRLAPGREPDPERLLEMGTKSTAFRTKSWAFEFLDLDPGTYLLGAARQFGAPIARTALVHIDAGLVEQDLVVAPLEPEDALVLYVLDPAGRPTTDVRVHIGFRSEKSASFGSAAVIPRGDGSFLVLHPPRGKKEAGAAARHFLRVTSERWGHAEAAYVPRETSEVTIRLTEPATLEATVLGLDGSGLDRRLTVMLQETERRRPRPMILSSGTTEATPNSEGRVLLGPVQPGSYDVDLRVDKKTIAAVPVTLLPGKNKISVDLPPLYRLVVIVEAADPGRPVSLRWIDPRGGKATEDRELDEHRRATFEHLPAGEYWISLRGGRRLSQMRTFLPGPEVVTFRDVAPDSMAVTVDDPSGLLGEAGFATGDVVVGANGVLFAELDHVESFMGSAMSAGGAIRFQVSRGGQLLEISVDAERFRSGAHGGRLEWMIR
jgi:hypothetical protein